MKLKWLLIGGVVLVVVVVVAIVALTSRDSGPPPVASGRGVFRVHVQSQPDGGVRAPDELSYQGTTFRVAYGGASGSGDAQAASLAVTGPSGSFKPAEQYRKGATIALDGAQLKVRAIYAGASDRDDLVDLQVIPAG